MDRVEEIRERNKLHGKAERMVEKPDGISDVEWLLLEIEGVKWDYDEACKSIKHLKAEIERLTKERDRLRHIVDVCPLLSDDTVKQPCIEGPCGVTMTEPPKGETK